MSVIESATMETSITRSEDGRHTYLLSREWNPEKKQAMLIMLMAGSADTVAIDTTGMLVVSNLHKLGYGGIKITNLFTNQSRETDEENDRIILETAEKSEQILVGWGTGSATNPAAQRRIGEVLALLRPYQERMFCIASPAGKKGLHPLAPALRKKWDILPWLDEVAHEEKQKSPSQRERKGKGAGS